MGKEFKIISGGWKNVPENWMCKTDLRELGLVPTGEPLGTMWNAYNWILLYDANETRPKKKATESQLESLKRGRETQRKRRSCDICDYFQGRTWTGYEHEGKKICMECLKDIRDKERIKCAEEWFYSLRDIDFLILDTETTGLDDGSEVVQLGIINKNGDTLFNRLIKPKNPIPEEAIMIHGITNKMVENSPSWPEVYSEVEGILKDKNVLIYNANYDTWILDETCQIWGLQPLSLDASCVMKAYSESYASDRWVSLERASGVYTEHDAIEDCLSVLKIIHEIWEHETWDINSKDE